MKQYRFLTIVVIALMMLAALPMSAQEETGPAPVGLRPDAPTYALHGPYWVGTRHFEGVGERLLEGYMWYPATNPDGLEEKMTYTAIMKMVDGILPADFEVNPDIYGHALQDAALNMGSAPYPLVVFSHGFGTSAPGYAHLTEHFASYGFVVIAPEHQEYFDFEYSEIWESSIERPQDIKQILDYAETLTAAGGLLEGMIDMDRVAVVGHSYGGYAALAAAGARYDLAAFNARCAALPADDPNQFLCTPLIERENDMAELAGIDPNINVLWPSFGDARVDVIIPMAGDSYMFDKAGLAEITIPMMAMGGTLDTGTPFAWGAEPSYENATSEDKALVAFENGEHMIFATKVEDYPFATDSGWNLFYTDAVWDKDRVLDLINHFATAFLLDELKDDPDAHSALLAENVAFPGITYETTMK